MTQRTDDVAAAARLAKTGKTTARLLGDSSAARSLEIIQFGKERK